MALGKNIIVSGEPKGKNLDVIVDGTPKPGTLMTLKAATEPVSGMHTYEAFNRDADGDLAEIAILLPDVEQGIDELTAFATGTVGKVYFPLMGETVNALVANLAGTADAFAIGDYLIVDNGTGKLIATTGSPQSEPFKVLETVAGLTADKLVHVMYTGH